MSALRQFSAGLVPIVMAAHEHGLLAAVKAAPAGACALAAKLELDPRATRLVLDALAVAGFCQRDADGCYHHVVTMDHPTWNHVGTMLKTGEVLPYIDDATARPEAYRLAVDRLAERFASWAEALAARLPPARKILDVGAGSGVWSLAMAARAPDTEVVGLDFDEVLGSFTARARASGLHERVSTISGSYFDVPVPASFDRVVLANVLHLETRAGVETLIRRFAGALAPGGALVIIDCVGEGTPERDFTRALYALHLGLRTAKGGVHPAAWLTSVCEQSGLDVRLELLDEKAPGMGALIAQAPSAGGELGGEPESVQALIRAGEVERGRAGCVRAADTARRIGSPVLEVQAALVNGAVVASCSVDDTLEMAPRECDRETLLEVTYHATLAEPYTGSRDERFEEARDVYGQAIVIARRIGAQPLVELAEKARDSLAAPRPAVSAPSLSPRSISLLREGDVWTITSFTGVTVRLKDAKGIRFLDRLLASPDQDVHVADLVGLEKAAGDTGPMLDAQAKAAYRHRLEALRDQLEEAEGFGDDARAARVREELEVLGTHLAAAVGLGGRDRSAHSLAERARVNVQRRIRNALDRIEEQDLALGRYLKAAVRTGIYCSYAPPLKGNRTAHRRERNPRPPM